MSSTTKKRPSLATLELLLLLLSFSGTLDTELDPSPKRCLMDKKSSQFLFLYTRKKKILTPVQSRKSLMGLPSGVQLKLLISAKGSDDLREARC